MILHPKKGLDVYTTGFDVLPARRIERRRRMKGTSCRMDEECVSNAIKNIERRRMMNYNKKTIPRICQTCGKDFLARKAHVDGGNGRFCSKSCAKMGKTNPSWKNGEHATPRRRAEDIVHRAVKNGELVRRPCETCGNTINVDGHHDDYSKPLAVRWLCRSCHMKEHTQGGTQ